MRLALGWKWPRGDALSYCARVSIAALAGYLLSLGGPQYALYGAFTAALVVGTSRGEDIGSAANRARGTMAGMIAGVAAAQLAAHPAIAVAAAVAVTAYLCMACGWGQAAARIGSSMAAVTALAHSGDAIEYTFMRMGNTVIGIAAGLAVSYMVLPVTAKALLERDTRRALDAVEQLHAAVARDAPWTEQRAACAAVFQAMVALQKTIADARNEIGADHAALREQATQVGLACIGAFSAFAAASARPAGDPTMSEGRSSR